MEEVWKPVRNYDKYEVSNLGRIKSFKHNNKILHPYVDNKGYKVVCLFEKGVKKRRPVHQLVAESFLNHTPNGFVLVVNHIDSCKTNNNVSNLEIVTQRQNLSFKNSKHSSKYIGVHWNTSSRKWAAAIHINSKRIHLGYFIDELEAAEAYQKELNLIKQNEGNNI